MKKYVLGVTLRSTQDYHVCCNFAVLLACLAFASAPVAIAQNQTPGCPVPQNPAPSGAPMPKDGCMYAGQPYSSGARLGNGQTCSNGSWS